MILIKSFLTGVLYDWFKLIYRYLNEGNKVRECFNCLKMMIQVHLHVGFITYLSLNMYHLNKSIYIYMKLLQSSKIFKQKNNHEVHCN